MIDSKPNNYRYAVGKNIEDQIMNCLNNSYKEHGYNLIPSSKNEDTKEKTDCWQKSKNGNLLRSAIKARFTKNDILIAMRDPFWGFNNKNTIIGRDVLYEYFQYITLSKDQTTIRVASGKVIHRIYNDLWDEITSEYNDNDIKKIIKKNTSPLRLLNSNKHIKCEIWLHFDRYNGNPKLLGFIPPDYLIEHKEIKYHKFLKE